MPQQLTYPGVYVEEVPSGVRAISGVATSVAAFIGRARKGATDRAIFVSSYSEFVDEFGPLSDDSRMGFAVRDFYLNGGRQAVICRLYKPPAAGTGVAAIPVGAGATAVAVVAASPGAWGNNIRVAVDHQGIAGPVGELFNLTVSERGGRVERFVGLSLYSDRTRNVRDALARESRLVRWDPNANLLAPPQGGAARQGPPDGADAASAQEGAAETARKAAATALAQAAAASGAKVAADAAKQKAADALVAATAAKNASQQALDQATADHQAAEALPAADPERAEKIAAAQAAKDAAQAALDAATQTETDAQAASDQATQDATAADAAATAATQAADAAKTAQSQANQAVAGASAFGGDDGIDAGAADVSEQAEPRLAKTDIFNLLCIPPYKSDGSVDVEPTVYDWAASFCAERRALLLVDAPSAWTTVTAAVDGFRAEADQIGGRSSSAAVYFPRLQQPNPLKGDAIETFVPCGAVAGVMARTDAQRGVWKAPAGLEATLRGVRGLSVPIDDDGNGRLNPLGVNCLRAMPAAGRVIWGARTLVGADSLASEWKYVPIRRLALFIEETLFRGTRWVVFEPNDEPLWAQIRLNVGSFMHQLFRQGAFQGKSPRDAYFVKCDGETTTQADRDLGVVNINVGFAPLKPAEFVVVRLQQLAGQTQA